MKSSRLHSVHRSLAHSAGATIVLLAAALTSAAPVAALTAAPVAAPTAAPPDRGEIQIFSCQTTRVQSPRLESVVWSVLFGPQGPQTQETRCAEGAAAGEQEEARGVLRPMLAP
ncbi:hypothetical protein [Streptomyces tibetensis]|uniref:hypothetical protein n=1 Tax=Streptomyces tibetensis TaxID=2382123 RepID=UPI0033D59DC2